uniref:Uncharacterized protein n=1 Tax=Candidatus Kentrum sp. LPFa TaxID=2126335 RepID=A0A450X5K2_9GAMM|nr:MAG: hypothetical protein BECKLPF1236B_GA0070989_14172 [Candidatus Kentron sp. LPFa]
MRFAYPPYAGTFFICWGDETLNMIVRYFLLPPWHWIPTFPVGMTGEVLPKQKILDRFVEDLPGNRLICFNLQVTVTERDFWRGYRRKHQTSCLNPFEILRGKFKHGV